MDYPVLAALLSALLGALGAYLAAVRKLSGKVGTSEAAQLWQESKNMRDEYRSRITELVEVVSRCEKRIEALEKRNNELYLENGRLSRMIEGHEATIAELRAQVHRLSNENDALQKGNKRLRERVAELETAL